MRSQPASVPGIEFLLVGPAKVGKTSIAKRLAQRFDGSYFNLSVYNRLIAWWDLRCRTRGQAVDILNQAAFSETLACLTAETTFDRRGRILHRGVDISDELESLAVSLQASEQGATVYCCYRSQLNPVVWNVIAGLKRAGPVFVVARRRSSVFTARRAVYINATLAQRAGRLRESEPSLSAPEAEAWIQQRDLAERTFFEKDECDAFVDSSERSIEETVNVVAAEYEKARLVTDGNFYALRPLVALDRMAGEHLLGDWLREGRRFLLCCADLDHQGKYKNSFGKQVDLLSYFLAALSDAAAEHGGIPIIWGSDDILILFPFEVGAQREARARLDRVRKGYLCRNAGRLGVAAVTGRNGELAPASTREVVIIGEFTGRFAGEELFPFEVRRGASLEGAFSETLAHLNGRLQHADVVLSGHAKCLVPTSTATLGGVLVHGARCALRAADLVDAAYGAMQDAKTDGRNCSYLFALDELSASYRFAGQPLVADDTVIAEISRRPSERYSIPRREQREHYPFLHNTTALEQLVARWLTRPATRSRCVVLLYPGFSGRAVAEALTLLAAKGEVPAEAVTEWVLPHGYWFKALSRVYSQQNRDILIRASAHAFRIAVAHWMRGAKRHRSPLEQIRIATMDGQPLRGLRLAIECFWFFEGDCEDEAALELLRAAQLELAMRIRGLDIKVLGLVARLDGVSNARDVFRQVDVFRDFVMDPSHRATDEHGNVLVRIEMSSADPQVDEDHEDSSQQQNLKDLRASNAAAPGLVAFCAFECDLWRGHKDIVSALGCAQPDAMVCALAVIRAARRLDSWETADLSELVGFLAQSSGHAEQALMAVFCACGGPRLRTQMRELLGAEEVHLHGAVAARGTHDAKNALDVVARFVSSDDLALLDFRPVDQPLGGDELRRALGEVFEQVPEIPYIVWRDDAPEITRELSLHREP